MYSSFYRRTFLIATVAILAYLLFTTLRPLAGPLGWAGVLAFLLIRLHEWLTRKLKGRGSLSAGILTALTPIFVIGPLALIGVVFAQQVAATIQWMRGRTILPYPALLDRAENVPALGGLVHWARANATFSAAQIQDWATNGAQSLLKSAAQMGGTLALGVAGSLVGFFMMLFLLFFFVRDGRRILDQLTKFIPVEKIRRDKLLSYLADVTRAVVFGSVATALIQGILAGVGFAFVGLPSPVVFAVLATIAAFLPAGSAIVLIPAVLYLMATGRWGAAIFLAVWSAAVGIIDNFLRPFLTSRQAEVSTLAVFLGAVGGASAFGILGLVIGPVLLGFTAALLEFAEEVVAGKE